MNSVREVMKQSILIYIVVLNTASCYEASGALSGMGTTYIDPFAFECKLTAYQPRLYLVYCCWMFPLLLKEGAFYHIAT